MSQLSQNSKADPRQSFTDKAFAEMVAEIAERMTGEPHMVMSKGTGYHYIVRYTHDWMKAGWA